MTFLRLFLTISTLLLPGVFDRVMAQDADRPVPNVLITEGVAEPHKIAFPNFFALTELASEEGQRLLQVVIDDLVSTGLFVTADPRSFIDDIQSFNTRPRFEDWRAIGVQWLVTGETELAVDGRLAVRFRLWEIFTEQQKAGLQFFGPPTAWRRIGHRVADTIYSEITAEDGYFDSRIVFVEETGPKNQRRKRLALMDQDGANIRYLTGTGRLSMTPRFSPSQQQITYISFADDRAQVYIADIDSGENEFLGSFSGMSFAPRFSPDGRKMVMSIEQNGNTDIYLMDLDTRERIRLTSNPAIDTSPSFSPDGERIAFESDRARGQQVYVMNADGSNIERISFGDGRYATPVWSPRGDLIAFTKQHKGKFYIGLMTPEGEHEQLLTNSYHDEGPTWSPNGRILMFFREFRGFDKLPKLYTIDVSGKNLREVRTPAGASDPAWSPLIK